jgi:hypothetical protein
VAGFGDLVEAGGKRPLVRERTAPFVAIVDETTKPPARQLEFDQRQRGVGPCAGSNQPLDAGPCKLMRACEPRTGLRGEIGQELRRECRRSAQPLFQLAQARFMRRRTWHDTIS